MTEAITATLSPIVMPADDRQARYRKILSYVSLITGCELEVNHGPDDRLFIMTSLEFMLDELHCAVRMLEAMQEESA